MRTHLTKSEKLLKEMLSREGYIIERNNLPGHPDFAVLSPTGEKIFDVEVKSSIFGANQIEHMIDTNFNSDAFRLAVVSKKINEAVIQIYRLEKTKTIPLPPEEQPQPAETSPEVGPHCVRLLSAYKHRSFSPQPVRPPPHPIIFGPEPGVMREKVVG